MKRQLRAGLHAPFPTTVKFVLSLVFSCTFLNALNAVDFTDINDREAVQRDSKVDTIDPLLAEAVELRDKGNYKAAVEKCDQALRKIRELNLGDGPFAVAKRSMVVQLSNDIRSQWGKVLVQRARTLMQEGYAEAAKDPQASSAKVRQSIELAREARRESPDTQEAVEQILQMGDKMLRSNTFRQDTSIAGLDPENASRKEQIAIHLREAAVFYKNKQYARARDVLEQVLVLDPYNEKAVYDLKKVYRRLYRIAELRRENEVLEARSDSEWKWTNSILPRGDQLAEERGPQEAVNEGKTQMYEKLQSIIIPEVDFGGVNISSIVRQLNKRSRECDPEGKGINLIYSPSDNDIQEVTLNFTNMPIGEIIRYLCQYARLKYKVEDKAVRIASEGIDDMDTRYFKMRSAVYARLANQKAKPAERKSSSGGGNDGLDLGLGTGEDFGESIAKGSASGERREPLTTQPDTEALKKYFELRGIRFEPGSSIAYDERSSKLTVKNTPENLRAMENLLREIDIVTPLVLIEAKFLEISVTDLEELGFDWTMTRDNSNPAWMTGIANSETGLIPFTGAQMFQTLTRHYAGADSAASTSSVNPAAFINNLNIMPNFGPNGAYNVFLTVNAIDQSERGEVLSAPKIIATSGVNATIEFAKQMYFPDTWNEPEVTTSNNTYLYTPPYPDFGDETAVGITFSVTPYVSSNNHTIELTLSPKILDLVGWTEYNYDIIIGNTSSQNAAMKMPELAVREIDTKVKVYDGETIVLGGILEDSSSQLDDKYPFLGDFPLLGRLFSTQAHRQVKRNLMVFVTTRIMNLDGVPVKTKNDNGLFDFNR